MKHLKIERFGPVKEVDLELRDVNLFIGEQSIGKSTLAKLIAILTDYISLCKLIFSGVKEWEIQLKQYNLDVYSQDNYRIVYDMEEEKVRLHLEVSAGNLSYQLTKDGAKVTEKSKAFSTLMMLKPIYHTDEVLSAMRKTVESQMDAKELEKVFTMMNNSLYIPAERIIYSVINDLMPALMYAKSTVPPNLIHFMVELKNAQSVYPYYGMPILEVSYKKVGSDDYFVLDANKKEYPMVYASSGIQSTMPLLLVLQYAVEHREYSSFVIEEPECNLFPEKQVELLKHIISTVKNDSRTLTITTHSPYLLSAMNNCLFAGTLQKKFGDKIGEKLEAVLPEKFRLKPGDCSVYSLGERINGGDVYCKNLLDEETGMIDFNALDGVTALMSNEFESLENALVEMLQ